MNKKLLALLLLSHALVASASEQSICNQTDKGYFLSGTITTSAKFQSASQTIQGVQISHTILYMHNDVDGRNYQVALDNVFATDYVKNSTSMPPSLAALKAGGRIEVCGAKYSDGTGVHWAHTNCGDVPTTSAPNGFVKTISSSGTIGSNLERSQAYCYLWN